MSFSILNCSLVKQRRNTVALYSCVYLRTNISSLSHYPQNSSGASRYQRPEQCLSDSSVRRSKCLYLACSGSPNLHQTMGLYVVRAEVKQLVEIVGPGSAFLQKGSFAPELPGQAVSAMTHCPIVPAAESCGPCVGRRQATILLRRVSACVSEVRR